MSEVPEWVRRAQPGQKVVARETKLHDAAMSVAGFELWVHEKQIYTIGEIAVSSLSREIIFQLEEVQYEIGEDFFGWSWYCFRPLRGTDLGMTILNGIREGLPILETTDA